MKPQRQSSLPSHLTDASLCPSSVPSSPTNNIQVLIRIRPLTDHYLQLANQSMSILGVNSSLLPPKKCILDVKDHKQLTIPRKEQLETYAFDFVGTEDSSQSDIFSQVGKPIVD